MSSIHSYPPEECRAGRTSGRSTWGMQQPKWRVNHKGMGYSTRKNHPENSSLPEATREIGGIKHESNLTNHEKNALPMGECPGGNSNLMPAQQLILNSWSLWKESKKPNSFEPFWTPKSPLYPIFTHLSLNETNNNTSLVYQSSYTLVYLLWGNELSFNILKLPITNWKTWIHTTRALEGFQCCLRGEVLQLLHVLPESEAFLVGLAWWI